MTYLYRAFGLTVASEIACPELLPGSGPADAQIRFGRVPAQLSPAAARGPFHRATPEQCLLLLEEVAGARFLIANGREIVIERAGQGNASTIRTYLLGSALAALLYQRKLLPLHGSVVATPAGAALLAGAAGSGKSTLAAFLARQGERVLADDVCAVTLDGAGRPLVHPAWPSLRLLPDALARLALTSGALHPKRMEAGKTILPLAGIFDDTPRPLAAVYVLTPAAVSRPRLARLAGPPAVALLQRQVYRGEYAADLGRLQLQFETVTAVAGHARIYRVERPVRGFLLAALAAAIRETWDPLPADVPMPAGIEHG